MVEVFDSAYDRKMAQYSLPITNRLLLELDVFVVKDVKIGRHIINLLFLNDYYTINQRYKKVIDQIEQEKAQVLQHLYNAASESVKEIAGNDQSPKIICLVIEEEKQEPSAGDHSADIRLPLLKDAGHTTNISSCEMTPSENLLRNERHNAFKLI